MNDKCGFFIIVIVVNIFIWVIVNMAINVRKTIILNQETTKIRRIIEKILSLQTRSFRTRC